MKQSIYNFFFRTPSGQYVYNTFSDSILSLSMHEYNLLREHEEALFSDDLLSALKKQGVIIDDEIDELALILFDRNYYCFNNAPYYRILTTTGCNVRCPYCYEKGTPVVSMDENTAKSVVTFITTTCKAGSPFRLEWFGGEPLINQAAIDIITEGLSSESCHPTLTTMVTNGLLISDNTVDKMRKWGISSVQITLDGPEKKYNVIKRSDAIQNPYARVIRNIQLVANAGISVSVRINVSGSCSDYRELIADIKRQIGKNGKIHYYFYPIFTDSHDVSKSEVATILSLEKELLDSGLKEQEELVTFMHKNCSCFSTNMNGFTIGPDGTLYNCSHMMKEEQSVGSIVAYNPYNPRRIKFIDQSLSAECKQCVFLPICQGGCRAGSLQEANIQQCFLYKNGFEDLLKLKYRLEV